MSSEELDPCPEIASLRAFSEGTLTGPETTVIEHHLDHCDHCCREVMSLEDTHFDAVFAKPVSRPNDSPLLSNLIAKLQTQEESLQPPPEQGLEFLNPPTSPDSLGTLGRFSVLEEVGRGGMGIVLKALDPDLQRLVALKVLSPTLAAMPAARERFLREARAAAKLEHEFILPVYEVQQSDPLPYLVLPFVDGIDLQERLEEDGPLPLSEILTLGYQLSLALEEAHAANLVHRDIKPANVLLRGDQRLWLADFGLARAAEELSLTRTGTIAGSPPYMSPEQVRGEELDARSDLFSLGCVLYAMTAGQSPFYASNLTAVLRKVDSQEVPKLSTVQPALPSWFRSLVGRLLEKDPNARPQSASEVRSLFEQHGQDPKSPPPKRFPFLLTSIALLALTALFLALFLPKDDQSPPDRELPAGFYLLGNEKTFPSLEEAIAAAEGGQTVIIRKSGKLPVTTIDLGQKSLTIRSGAGYHPILANSDWREAILKSNAPLCLEGLEFQHPHAELPAKAAPILELENGPVFLANCRFVRPTNRTGRRTARFATAPVVQLKSCPSVEIINCEFYTLDSTTLSLEPEETEFHHSLRAVNNLMTGQINIRLEAPGPGTASWDLRHNTMVGTVTMALWPNALPPTMSVHGESNLYDFKKYFLWVREDQHRISRQHLKLSGTRNLFRASQRLGLETGDPYFLSRQRNPESKVERGSLGQFKEFTTHFGALGTEASSSVLRWDRINEFRNNSAAMSSALFEPTDAHSDQQIGFSTDSLGPGEAYKLWRESTAYEDWSQKVHEQVR